MDHNNILPVVLAGGKAKRFGGNKPEAKLRDKILIDYILSEILKVFTVFVWVNWSRQANFYLLLLSYIEFLLFTYSQ